MEETFLFQRLLHAASIAKFVLVSLEITTDGYTNMSSLENCSFKIDNSVSDGVSYDVYEMLVENLYKYGINIEYEVYDDSIIFTFYKEYSPLKKLN